MFLPLYIQVRLDNLTSLASTDFCSQDFKSQALTELK
jgi:hypothetical protein